MTTTKTTPILPSLAALTTAIRSSRRKYSEECQCVRVYSDGRVGADDTIVRDPGCGETEDLGRGYEVPRASGTAEECAEEILESLRAEYAYEEQLRAE